TLMYSVAMLRSGGIVDRRINATAIPNTSDSAIEMTLMPTVHSTPHSNKKPRSLTTRQSKLYGTTLGLVRRITARRTAPRTTRMARLTTHHRRLVVARRPQLRDCRADGEGSGPA